MYEVPNPVDFDGAMLTVLSALALAGDAADFYCLVPVRAGKRLYDGAVRLSASTIEKMDSGSPPNWESFVPIPVPEEIARFLAALPIDDSVDMQVLPSFLGVLASTEYARAFANSITDLGTSAQPFDKCSHARYFRRLEEVHHEIRVGAHTANFRLQQAFGEFVATTEYCALNQFAKAAESNFEQTSIYNVSTLTAEEMKAAVKSLLRQKGA
jgi:hypothetical protein